MFDSTRREGADQFLALAGKIAAELSLSRGRAVRVLSWRGSGGKMDWEYLVEIDGTTLTLEVGDSSLLLPHDENVRAAAEERIRHQLTRVLETTP